MAWQGTEFVLFKGLGLLRAYVKRDSADELQQRSESNYDYAVERIRPDGRFAQSLCMEGNQIQNLMLQGSVMRPGKVIKMIECLSGLCLCRQFNVGAVDWKKSKKRQQLRLLQHKLNTWLLQKCYGRLVFGLGICSENLGVMPFNKIAIDMYL
ncbi:hypothetical protein Tco_0121799 [Tanacetum coccineum]